MALPVILDLSRDFPRDDNNCTGSNTILVGVQKLQYNVRESQNLLSMLKSLSFYTLYLGHKICFYNKQY